MNRFKKIKNLSIVELAHLLAETASACPKTGKCMHEDEEENDEEDVDCTDCWYEYLKGEGEL